MVLEETLKPITATLLIFLLLAGIICPTQAATVQESFLNDEAGIIAFFQFTGPTNLESNLLRNLFRTVSTANDTYLIGVIPAAGYEQSNTDDVKVFIHNAGWVVVAYYPKGAPVAQIVDLDNDPQTRLDKVLDRVAFAIDVTDYQVQYAHAQYPQAQRVLRVGRMRNNSGISEFEIRLPASNQYDERSYFLRTTNGWNTARLYLDGPEYASTTGAAYAVIPPAKMVSNARHIIGVKCTSTFLGYTYTEMDILYSGSTDFTIDYADWIRLIDLAPIPDGLTLAAADVPRYFSIYLPVIRGD